MSFTTKNKKSTLVMEVLENTGSSIVYSPIHDNRERHYLIPRFNKFPFELLVEGNFYCIHCEEVNNIWRWKWAFPVDYNQRIVEDDDRK